MAAVGTAQRRLAASGAGEAQIVAQRRMYLRLAEGLARRIGARALITGDSLGQVASRTLPKATNTTTTTTTTTGRLVEIEARAGLDGLIDNVLNHIQVFNVDTCEETADAMATQQQ